MTDVLDSDIEIPGQVLALGERIASAGGELFIVGGWVRDRLLGKDSKDIDLATNLAAEKVKEVVSGLGSIYDLGERFGTVGVMVGGYNLEITTYRREEYTPGSRHPKVTPVEDITEDLARRDFTINALALSIVPDPGRLIDTFEGIEDLRSGFIRTPLPPAQTMAEDPLRMMRAVRFAAQLGYDIDPGLLRVLSEKAGLLETISRERRRDELERILISPSPDNGIRTLVATGLMDHVSPEVAALKDVEQPPAYHRADVLEHTLLTMTYLEPDPLLRRAALFHDLGKPPAKVTEPKTMFPEHEKLGEALTHEAMRRLRYSNDDIQKTSFLVRRHMRPIHYRGDWSDAAVRRMIRDCTLLKYDEVIVPLSAVFELARADILAGSLDTVDQNLALLVELSEKVKAVQGERAIEKIASPLDGSELMTLFGRGPGPWLKEAKAHLTDLVVAGELDQKDKEEAARRARLFLEDAEG
jgi:poly(A) polymerase